VTQRQATCEPLPYDISCTATVIAPRVVLTAAHCLGNNPANFMAVFFGESVAAGGTVIDVRAGRVHPDFDPATHANDLAALILEREVPAGVVPAALRTTPLPDLTGTQVRIVGYGETSSAAGAAAGARRKGTAIVTQVSSSEVRLSPAPAISCRGDSGGPVFAPAGTGEELIAVTSWGDPGCAQFSVAIRIDPHVASFLQPILEEAENPSPRRPFDPDERLCASTCERDTDCPEETICFGPPGAPRRCTYHGFPQVELGPACTPTDDCEDPCAPVGDGCRRLIHCENPPGDHCGPADDPGCGCAAREPRAQAATTMLIGLVLIGVIARRRARRR
jgi:MYXO-CTERM domain-containing protein